MCDESGTGKEESHVRKQASEVFFDFSAEVQRQRKAYDAIKQLASLLSSASHTVERTIHFCPLKMYILGWGGVYPQRLLKRFSKCSAHSGSRGWTLFGWWLGFLLSWDCFIVGQPMSVWRALGGGFAVVCSGMVCWFVRCVVFCLCPPSAFGLSWAGLLGGRGVSYFLHLVCAKL